MPNDRRVYGQWAGNTRGTPEDTTRCAAEVWPSDGYVPRQCSRKRGHGKDGLFCRQHAKYQEERLGQEDDHA